ncbi:DsbA family protein [Micromonospora sp. NBC_01655]|uniref:DsbA family protein n=1 Tax=Micromonospora sp. NBC_01655 TaxID=2975983 RepID=UPI00224D7360|nr:thioredoxin domain-containing protein [Micromonospora sp. NBC_01655]MCX4473019.1 DsbA family protein [Micromonospora sp. NBC_01655]
MKRSNRTTRATPRRSPAIALAALVVFLGVVLVAQLTPGRDPLAAPSPSTGAASTGAVDEFAFVRRDQDDPMALGSVAAPVVLVQWTDMRCPYCAVFNRDTLPVLTKDYVDTGKVRIEIHDVAYFGEQSEGAAVAARAAGRQGKFFEYLRAVYAFAPEHKHPDLPREKLIAFARKADVADINRFTADLDDPRLRAEVQDNTTSAQQLGVSSVPFFVAGKTALSGAQPLDVFRAFLDDALTKAR